MCASEAVLAAKGPLGPVHAVQHSWVRSRHVRPALGHRDCDVFLPCCELYWMTPTSGNLDVATAGQAAYGIAALASRFLCS